MDLFYLVGFFVLVYLFSDSLLIAFFLVIIAYMITRNLKHRGKNHFFKIFLSIRTPIWLLLYKKERRC